MAIKRDQNSPPWLWITVGIPAVLAWVAYIITFLITPHLAMAGIEFVSPAQAALYAAVGYYVLMAVIVAVSQGAVIL